LEHSEQLQPEFRGSSPIHQENRTGMRQFKAALVPLQSAGESPLLVPNNSEAISEGGIEAHSR